VPDPPTEAELQAYLEANMDRFRTTVRLSFTQVYLKDDRADRASTLLEHLAGHPPFEPELEKLGDASLLPGAMQQADTHKLNQVFGSDFAATLSAAPLERWSGPHVSPCGLHLVYVSDVRLTDTYWRLSELDLGSDSVPPG